MPIRVICVALIGLIERSFKGEYSGFVFNRELIINAIGKVDDAVLTYLNSWYGHWHLLDYLMAKATSDILNYGPFAVAIVWLWFRQDDQVAIRKALVIAVATGLMAMFVARVLSVGLPFRERPFLRSDLGLHFGLDLAPGLRTWSAFPSDHAVLVFALIAGIWHISKRLGAVALFWGFFVVCLSRIYMGLHHPSDIVAGAMIGAAVFWLVNRSKVGNRFSEFAIIQEASRPQTFYAIGFLVLFELTIMFENLLSVARAIFELLRRAE